MPMEHSADAAAEMAEHTPHTPPPHQHDAPSTFRYVPMAKSFSSHAEMLELLYASLPQVLQELLGWRRELYVVWNVLQALYRPRMLHAAVVATYATSAAVKMAAESMGRQPSPNTRRRKLLGEGVDAPLSSMDAHRAAQLVCRHVHPHQPDQVLIGSTASSIIATYIATLALQPGELVMVPALLFAPHTRAVEAFVDARLNVLAYDVDLLRMCADVDGLAARIRAHEERRVDGPYLHGSSPLQQQQQHQQRPGGLLILASVRGCRLANAAAVVQLAHQHRLRIVELSVPSMRTILPEHAATDAKRRAGLWFCDVDIHVTSFEGSGYVGGAVAFVREAGVAAKMRAAMDRLPPPDALRWWMTFARNWATLVWAHPLAYRLYMCGLGVAQHLVSVLRHTHRWSGPRARPLAKLMRPPSYTRTTATATAPRQLLASWKQTSTWQDDRHHLRRDAQPHAALIRWLWAFLRSHQRADAECYGLWRFLSMLPSYIRVISAGDPRQPCDAVEAAASYLMLYAVEPDEVMHSVRRAGFHAQRVAPLIFSAATQSLPRTPTKEEEVVLVKPGPTAEAHMHHVVLIPFSISMSAATRAALHRCLTSMPKRWWCGDDDDAINPRFQYRSPQVEDVLSAIRCAYATTTSVAMRPAHTTTPLKWMGAAPCARLLRGRVSGPILSAQQLREVQQQEAEAVLLGTPPLPTQLMQLISHQLSCFVTSRL